ncbi:unnamed protein product, partial [Allacma fusca]
GKFQVTAAQDRAYLSMILSNQQGYEEVHIDQQTVNPFNEIRKT